MNSLNKQINIMTFDIEEWYHFDFFCTEDKWLEQESRIDYYLPKVLDQLDQKNIKATFFCLGWIARTYPEILQRIKKRGHELACHSDKHFFVREMTPKAFDADLKASLSSIEDAVGEKVTAFRAPSFSISEDSLWAFEILSENGITTDCSIFPTNRNFGGFPSYGEAIPSIIKYKNVEIKEFPISMGTLLGKQMVFGGGGYFRLFPYWMVKKQMQRLSYNMTYLHMRDFDYEQPIMEHLSATRKFKSYYGMKQAYPKFIQMLNDFEWMNLGQALDCMDSNDFKIIDLN